MTQGEGVLVPGALLHEAAVRPPFFGPSLLSSSETIRMEVWLTDPNKRYSVEPIIAKLRERRSSRVRG